MRAHRSVWIALAAVIAMVMMAAAQQPQKEIKHVTIRPTSPASGQEMYKTYCAVCHGTDGKGNGPAADALKVPPTDLTALASKNAGKYPALKVSAILSGEQVLAAHGSKDMPIWGHLFRSISSGHDSEVQQRVTNLNKYIESLQKK
ncbi:MAG: cytochrome c [Acidobacteriia bacterium]|nr:cytochrome c [Terriglobia bacterium]